MILMLLRQKLTSQSRFLWREYARENRQNLRRKSKKSHCFDSLPFSVLGTLFVPHLGVIIV
jgi:hypothetical protein